jgi:1,6-anhydro-N-acetylmuramate kinase
VCGGGAYNGVLLREWAPRWAAGAGGVDPGWAWRPTASRRWPSPGWATASCERQPGNLPAVTGAGLRVLGALYPR